MDTKQLHIDATHQKLREVVEIELQNFEWLLKLSEEKQHFLRSITITNGEWTEHFHRGMQANYALDAMCEGVAYRIEVELPSHAYVYNVKKDVIAFFTTESETRLLWQIFEKSNVRNLVAELNPNSKIKIPVKEL